MPLGLFRGVRTFTLTPAGAGVTDFRVREEFDAAAVDAPDESRGESPGPRSRSSDGERSGAAPMVGVSRSPGHVCDSACA
jgi:hypothetical protein